ncbi:L-lactate dehydrogenase complex protein LldG [Rhodoligotrophos appendicifer]|uniref:LutC/YkgG family protein n=1 Tax=Rhodoligotrophos appendicifer TaxID=987056 RepID=UPI001FEC5D2A|nr:lactate utilization protein [Rhodoligotrophos appendicifer]
MADAIHNRSAVLGAVRRALAAPAGDPQRKAAVDSRLALHPRNLVPQRGTLPEAKRIQLFKEMALAVNASVVDVARLEEVPDAVAAFLRSCNLPPRFRMGRDGYLRGLPWYRMPSLERLEGPAVVTDEASLSRAFGAVAETGTLVLTSGPGNPVTLNFLPDNHMVVVEADRIVGSYEEIWQRLRFLNGEAVMPRTVNMITGPSRTADIEQQIQLGAHGPRRLHIIIVGGR